MTKTKILLVEDDKSLREIYGVRLYSEGYDIISAGDGEEALALAIKERPPLVISDVMMPKISGFDMLDILRSTSETKGIKVIMMTALSSEDQRARGESLGADRYLVKSQVGIEDVVRAVHEVLGDAPVAGSIAPAAMQPAPSVFASPSPAPQPAPAPLPQPTAPFSTARPQSLGDRVINPIVSNDPPKDFSAMINAELGAAPSAQPAPQAPVSNPAPVVAPAPAPVAPAAPVMQPVIQPAPAPAPQPVAPPVMPAPQTPPPAAPITQPTSGLSFEETPAPAAPTQAPPIPPTPPTPGV